MRKMNSNWEKYGRDIRRLVENAVNTQNFQQLNQDITNSVNEAVNDIHKGIRAAGKAVTGAPPWQKQPPAGTWRGKGKGKEAAPQDNPARPDLFRKNTSVSAGGWALAICGYTLSSVTGTAVMVLLIIAFFLGAAPIGIKIALGILLPLFAGSSLMAWRGSSMLSALKRYRGYISGLRGRTYCNIKELSDRNGKSPQFVLKDLRKMIAKGWFCQGHLDQEATCLIVSHDTYQEYQSIQQQRREQERLAPCSQDRQETIQEEDGAGQVVKEGLSYLRKIQECNQAIPGEEISRKISRIETLVQKIFERVKESPESLEDIHKLMEYYLPTTVKLLEAYRQLECQPIQGDNITSSKQEIEKTLDTLYVAFGKLLDSLFEDVAWDVSTDISVLHTMLAQEGLTEGDFRKGE